jgi:hypothetical protein
MSFLSQSIVTLSFIQKILKDDFFSSASQRNDKQSFDPVALTSVEKYFACVFQCLDIRMMITNNELVIAKKAKMQAAPIAFSGKFQKHQNGMITKVHSFIPKIRYETSDQLVLLHCHRMTVNM